MTSKAKAKKLDNTIALIFFVLALIGGSTGYIFFSSIFLWKIVCMILGVFVAFILTCFICLLMVAFSGEVSIHPKRPSDYDVGDNFGPDD